MNWYILKAQLWELWRLTRMELLARFLAPLAYVWLCVYVPPLEVVVYFAIVLAALCSGLWLSSFDQRQRGGFPFILGFVHPVPVRWLVGVPLAWLLLSNALLYLVLVTIASYILPVTYPLWTFLPALLTITTCLAMATWGTTHFAGRAVVTIPMVFLLVLCFRPHLVLFDPLETNVWRTAMHFSPFQYGVMAGASLLATFGCVYFVWRQRCGASFSVAGARTFSMARARGPEKVLPPFFSSLRAQVWFDVRRVLARGVVTLIAGMSSMILVTGLLHLNNGGEAFSVLGTIFLFFVLTLILLTTEGVLGLKFRGSVLRLSIFEATQPQSVGKCVGLKLGVISCITFAGGLVMLLLGLCCAVFLMSPGELERVRQSVHEATVGDVLGWFELAIVLALAALWMCLSATTLAMGLGYGWALFEKKRGAPVLAALFILFPMFVRAIESISGWNLQPFQEIYLLAWGVLLMIAAGAGLWAIAHNRIYRIRTIGYFVGAWLVLMVLLGRQALLAQTIVPALTIPTALFVLGLLCVPIGSVAWAPLSLAARRHE